VSRCVCQGGQTFTGYKQKNSFIITFNLFPLLFLIFFYKAQKDIFCSWQYTKKNTVPGSSS